MTSTNGARTYAKITDVDLATSWNLTGDLTFLNFAGTGGSNFAAQFKLVDAVSPVPLPASALLLIAGVGGLAAMRRRVA